MNFLKRLFTRKKKEQKQTVPFSSSNYPKHVYHKSLGDASKEDYEYAEQKRREQQNRDNDLLNPLNVFSPLSPFNPIYPLDDTPNHNTDIEGGNFGGAGAGGSWGNDTQSNYEPPSYESTPDISDSTSCDTGSSSVD